MATVHRMGIVGVHNMEGAPALRAFQTLHRNGELKLRVPQDIPKWISMRRFRWGFEVGWAMNGCGLVPLKCLPTVRWVPAQR